MQPLFGYLHGSVFECLSHSVYCWIVAGRVFPGLCIRLVSSSFYKSCLRVFDLPEMQTAPLDKLYITVAHLTKQLNAVALAANPAAPDQQMGGQTARVSDKPASIHGISDDHEQTETRTAR